MSPDQSRRKDGFGRTASQSQGRPEFDDGPDAAEAAGFGGIAWADDAEATDGEARVQGSDLPSADGDSWFGAGTAASGEDGGPGATDGGDAQPPADGSASTPSGVSVEQLINDLEQVTGERDQYLDTSRRIQAEFENYRKVVSRREAEARERANESLVTEILPVLDACDGALASGALDVEPVRSTLMEVLSKLGLDRIDDQDAPFDPARHDAVMHEPADESDGPLVAEVMRAGYSWKGRVVRPAMVRVRG